MLKTHNFWSTMPHISWKVYSNGIKSVLVNHFIDILSWSLVFKTWQDVFWKIMRTHNHWSTISWIVSSKGIKSGCFALCTWDTAEDSYVGKDLAFVQFMDDPNANNTVCYIGLYEYRATLYYCCVWTHCGKAYIYFTGCYLLGKSPLQTLSSSQTTIFPFSSVYANLVLAERLFSHLT